MRDLFIFTVAAEANLTMITRLYNIFSRSRINVMDFQSVQVGDGQQRVLITVREAKVTAVKSYHHQLVRQVEVMAVDLFESVQFGKDVWQARDTDPL